MSMYYVFYADQLYMEFNNTKVFNAWRKYQVTENREIYDGAYIFDRAINEWWRMDMTPVLLERVPKSLRAWVLIL